MDENKSLTTSQRFALAAAQFRWTFEGVEMGLIPMVSRPALQDLLNVADDGASPGGVAVRFPKSRPFGGKFHEPRFAMRRP